MFKLDEVKVLHLEPTNKCNAVCPQCPRTIYLDKLVESELTLADIKSMLPIEFIRQLNKMFMCGNFGEPAAAKDALEIFKWFREVNPTIELGMNTNGGLRSRTWWSQLAKLTNYVVFSIDGLEDTNHIYRINVSWSKLIENVNAFIAAGGNAQWDMLVYEHNEHQILQATELAKAMGFKCFRSKVTRRKMNIDFLRLPKTMTFTPITSGSIKCHALQEQSIYLSAEGELLPCCFIGTTKFDSVPVTLSNSNLRTNNVSNIVPRFTRVTDTWEKDPLKICSDTCSTSTSNFNNQWKTEVNF